MRIRTLIFYYILFLFAFGWFGGNFALKESLNIFVKPSLNKTGDHEVKELSLAKNAYQGESLYFHDIVMEIPWHKEQFNHIHPSFHDHGMSFVELSFRNESGEAKVAILLREIPNTLKCIKLNSYVDVISRIIMKDNTCYKFIKEMYHASFADFSIWNFVHNLRLSYLLTMKFSIMPVFGLPIYVYDFETPFISGILIEGQRTVEGTFNSELNFAIDNKMYKINIMIADTSQSIRNIISTIRPYRNKAERLQTTIASYSSKNNSPHYPDELLILSRLSQEGLSVHNLEKLISMMKQKNYEPEIIEEIQQEIDYLSNIE